MRTGHELVASRRIPAGEELLEEYHASSASASAPAAPSASMFNFLNTIGGDVSRGHMQGGSVEDEAATRSVLNNMHLLTRHGVVIEDNAFSTFNAIVSVWCVRRVNTHVCVCVVLEWVFWIADTDAISSLHLYVQTCL